jgi:hypothetical protein
VQVERDVHKCLLLVTQVSSATRERRESVIASEAWLHRNFDDGLLKEMFSSSLCIDYLRDCLRD